MTKIIKNLEYSKFFYTFAQNVIIDIVMNTRIEELVSFLKKGSKIHIKESQKGSFTKYCNGKVTNECIQRGKNSPDPRIRKKATFAANARTWKHQYGGNVENSYVPSKEIVDYIKSTERFSPKWYKDGNGVLTIGYGFTGKEAQNKFKNGITRKQANEHFNKVLAEHIYQVSKETPNWHLLTQKQKDSMLSYHYNIGSGGYTNGSPKLQQALKDRNWREVVKQMDFGYNDSKNRGLRKRRDFERNMFSEDISNYNGSFWDPQNKTMWKLQTGGIVYKPIEQQTNINTNLDDFLFTPPSYPVTPVSTFIQKEETPTETTTTTVETSTTETPTVEPTVPKVEQPKTLTNFKGANIDNLNYINSKLTDAGYSKVQRAAILATIVQESGARPEAVGDAGKAKGLFQWHSDRFTAGRDLDSQIALIQSELTDLTNKNAWTGSKLFSRQQAISAFNGDDLHSTVSALTANFIRPANTSKEIERRYNIAQQILNSL